MASDQRANQVGANLRVAQDSHFWQLTSPATELQVGDSSRTLGANMASEAISWGSMPPTSPPPPSLFTLKHMLIPNPNGCARWS